MKKTLKYILASFTLMAVAFTASAQGGQTYHEEGGVSTSKVVTGPSGGVYTISLETFATGEQTVVQKSIPSDIILLLDYSSSMLTNDNITTLKGAVVDFVKEMQENNSTLVLEPGQMGNRIAFVLYAGLLYDDYPASTTRVNTSNNCYENDYPYFNAKYVNQFIEVTDLDASATSVIYNETNIISPSSQHDPHPSYLSGSNFGDTNKGTNTPAAMAKALELVNQNQAAYSSDERSTTVILFTDGEPCDIYQQYYQGNNQAGSGGFSTTYANACLSDAKTIKDAGVSIYTVGLFTNPSAQVKTFVEYTSSDFPEATAMPAAANYLSPTGDYGEYCTIVSGGLDLSAVFKTIASASGGENAELGVGTEVRDVVSGSFNLPEGTDPSDIRVYTSTISSDGESWGTLTPIFTTETEQANNIVVDGAKVSVSGFDFGSTENFVGKRYKGSGDPAVESNWEWRGKKLVIQIDIQADNMATGGNGTNTNTPESGVYVNGVQINSFDVPHTNLPVSLVIVKQGLHHGESATFTVWRCPALRDADQNIVYNAIGKPKPNGEWAFLCEVIVSNYGTWGQDAQKVLSGLDPSYVYKITEDNWSWSYTLTNAQTEIETMTTAETEKNPFTFKNKDKEGVAKHGEAVVSNHFGTGEAKAAKSDKKAR